MAPLFKGENITVRDLRLPVRGGPRLEFLGGSGLGATRQSSMGSLRAGAGAYYGRCAYPSWLGDLELAAFCGGAVAQHVEGLGYVRDRGGRRLRLECPWFGRSCGSGFPSLEREDGGRIPDGQVLVCWTGGRCRYRCKQGSGAGGRKRSGC